jgi:hypothetical protein
MKLFAQFFLVAVLLASAFSASANTAEPAKAAQPDLAKGEASYGAVCAVNGRKATASAAPSAEGGRGSSIGTA